MDYDTNNDGIVDKADKLATARTIALTGAVSGSATFDGSSNISIVTTGASAAAASFVVMPEQYGAKPNGTTDCTAAFASAINAIEAAGGGTLQLSTGVYIVSTVKIVAQMNMRGVGFGSVLKLKAGTNGHLIQPKYDSLALFTLEDFAIDGSNESNTKGSGIYLTKNASTRAPYLYHTSNGQDLNSLIRNMLIYNCAEHGIFADAPVSITYNIRALHLDNVWLMHNKKSGLYGKSMTDFKLSNCISIGNGDGGISMYSCSSGHLVNCKAFYNLQNNASVEKGEFHIDNSGRTTFTACEAQEGVRHGFYINAGSFMYLNGCIADSNGQGVSGYYGYYLAGGCTYMTVRSGATSFHTPSWQYRALYIENGSNNTIDLMVKNQIDATPYTLSPANLNIRITINGTQVYPAPSGSGAPTASALYIGQDYVDTTNKKVYKAVKVGSGGGDWALLN